MDTQGRSPGFVPEDFDVPGGLDGDGFRLEPLGGEHNAADHEAWTSSTEHIRATPGFPMGDWPPVTGMSLEENLADLRRHAEDYRRRAGFTYTVLETGTGRVVGCVYIYPLKDDERGARVASWVRADRADLDVPLHHAVATWLDERWPFSAVRYAPRRSS